MSSDSLREKIALKVTDAVQAEFATWDRQPPDAVDPYVITVDSGGDCGSIADALLPLIREAQADAWDEGAMAYATRYARDESLPLTNPYRGERERGGQ